DGRIGIVLRWLEVLGVTEGSFEENNLSLVGELDVGALPPFLGNGEKRQADLKGLLTMVRFAGESQVCRRASLAEHFSLDSSGEVCPACDVCHDSETYLEAKHGPRALAVDPVGEFSSVRDGSGFSRGDWVEVGRHMGQVVRVEGRGSQQVLWVEGAADLKRRRVDPRQQCVRKLPPGSSS
ncbi:MAG: hypothetical protein GY930_03940, partial [bacterium]|nr:hypothetical protein [bacterium]